MATKPTTSPTLNSGNSLYANLLHSWLMWEGSGTTVHDGVGSPNNGTFSATPAPTWTTNGAGDPIIALGSAGAQINLASGITLGQPWTIALRFHKTNDDNQGMVIGDTVGTLNYMWFRDVGTGLTIDVNGNGATYTATGTTADHNWLLTYDGTNIAIYKDGSNIGGSNVGTLGNFTINTLGAAYTSTAFSLIGKLDYIHIYSAVLDGTHIAAMNTDPYQMYQNGSSTSAVITEQNLPANHLGNITVHVVGTGTSWTSSTTWTPSGVAGWSVASKTQVSGTQYTIVLTPPTAATPPVGATGTLTLTEGVTGTVTATTTVGTPSFTRSPTSGTTGTTPTLTLTGTNTIWSTETAAGLFTVSGGTGASLATPTVTTNTAATDVLTVGSAAGTLTITDTSTGATVSFAANAPPAVTAGTATFTDATTTQVNASCTAASGGTPSYTYQWQFCTTANGTFVNISGQTSLTLADTVNNLGFRQLVVTDSLSQTATSNPIYGGRWAAPIILGGVGDSIMVGYPNYAPNDPLTSASLLLPKLTTLRRVTIGSSCNQGIAGSKTADWLPTSGSGDIGTAETAFTSAGVTDVLLMLGTNDSRSSVSAATYGANLGTITTHLLANVSSLLRIWLCYPPWSTDFATLTAARQQLLVDYEAQINSLVNGTTIRSGDRLALQYFAANVSQLTDTVHLTNAGYASLGNLWASGMDNSLNGSSGGGGQIVGSPIVGGRR